MPITTNKEKHAVIANQQFSEQYDHGEGKPGHTQVKPCLHPEHVDTQQEVAQCPPSDCCYQPDGVGSEPVEAMKCGQAYAAYCKGYSADYFYYEKKCRFQLSAIGFGFIVISAYFGKRAVEAVGTPCLAGVASMKNQPVVCPRYKFAGDVFDEGFLGFKRCA